MKFKKAMAFALTGALTVGAVCNGVFADSTTTVKLTVAEKYDTDYVMTIPADLTVESKGFNALSGLKVEHRSGLETTFDPNSKVSVTAKSANTWQLKAEGITDGIGYTLTSEEGGAATTSWEFTADEVNTENGTTKALGVDVENYDDAAPGEYTDTITFTAEVESSAVAVTGIELNKTSTEIKVGSDETLTATVSPEDATDKTVTWESSDTSVATVDENGKKLKRGARIRSVDHLLKIWSRIVRNGNTERPKNIKDLNQCLFGELCQLLPINYMSDEEIIANTSFRYNGNPKFLKEKDGKSNFATLMYRYVITRDSNDLDTLLNLHEKYCHSAGKVFGGLQKRRAVEANCFAEKMYLVLSQEEKDSLPEYARDKALVLRDLTVGASGSLDVATIKNAEEYLNKVTEIKGDTMEIQLQKKLMNMQYQPKPKPKTKAPVKTNQPTTVRVRRGVRGK
mgnify:CR=1 FL=1